MKSNPVFYLCMSSCGALGGALALVNNPDSLFAPYMAFVIFINTLFIGECVLEISRRAAARRKQREQDRIALYHEADRIHARVREIHTRVQDALSREAEAKIRSFTFLREPATGKTVRLDHAHDTRLYVEHETGRIFKRCSVCKQEWTMRIVLKEDT